MTRNSTSPTRRQKANTVLLRLALPPYTIHFKSPTYLHPHTLDLLDKKVCKETVKSTASNVLVREAIGADAKFWSELVGCLSAAVVSLEKRSFATSSWHGHNVTGKTVDYESTSGSLIAGNYPGLWRDLERLNDLVSTTRNVLTIGAEAQDLAADYGLETEIFRLINCCVRVTARGYDGDAGTGEEEKWQWIVNAYKKLLITCLQFLNNFVARNEKRKLMLWVSLFDNSVDAAGVDPANEPNNAVPPPPGPRPEPPINNDDILLAYGQNASGTSRLSPLEMEAAQPLYADVGFQPPPTHIQNLLKKGKVEPNAWVYFVHENKDFVLSEFHCEHKRQPMLAEVYRNIPAMWYNLLHGNPIDCGDEYIGIEGSEPNMWAMWQRKYQEAVEKWKADVEAWEKAQQAAKALPEPPPLPQPVRTKRNDPKVVEQKIKAIEQLLDERFDPATGEHFGRANFPDGNPAVARQREGEMAPALSPPARSSSGGMRDDMKMLFTAEAGARILESGKGELMKRLEGSGDEEDDGRGRRRQQSLSLSEAFAPRQPPALTDARRGSLEDSYVGSEEDLDEEEEESEEEEDEEEDYPGSTEDGRGLLTDVPLILGPSEIEVLPMLVMSGIVATSDQSAGNASTALAEVRDRSTSPTSTSSRSASPPATRTTTPTLLTHLLLSQTPGRNLLRELLIFVAAWDLREEELYFKFMIKIMEAILKNGLMPYAYHAFRDRSRSKDIISPAQAVVMKLVTGIFRGRNAEKNVINGIESESRVIEKVDLHVLNFIFTEFRQHIIPQTCALIFLQGQIHKGRASPEDFPLNLWDMERMYEGVYQYLEFFAVLTEEQPRPGEDPHQTWKGILAEWEMAAELVTLLRELEDGIPKMGVLPPVPQQVQQKRVVGQAPPPMPQRSLSADAAIGGAPQQGPVAVERPFELEDTTLPPLPSSAHQEPIFEAETPLAYPEDALPPEHHVHDQDEPSDFEWRNLKKLTVLVLSSLIWKNRKVQDQVRNCGGLEALVGCCRHDEHNPYIREHAIMCLRFAVEGCEKNSDVIKQMAATKGRGMLEGGSVTLAGEENVPKEVLDTNGYETFMDNKGQVGLRRKPDPNAKASAASASHQSSTTTATASASKPRLSATKMTAEKAAELMQNALRDLPLGDKLVTDKQKAEALARLDRAFESTEKALGKDVVGEGGKKG